MKTANKRARGNKGTLKVKRNAINGKIIDKKEGWIYLEVGGTPYEIGFAHGKLLRPHFKQVLRVLPFNVEHELKISYADYLRDCKRIFTPILDEDEWAFIKDELRGIVAGASMKGITYDFLVAWNSYLSMCTYYEKNHDSFGVVSEGTVVREPLGRCSAFIATGSATKTGEIVMAHNTHSDFATGFILNVVMRVIPSSAMPLAPISFVMQTAPGLICSSSDWFLCDNGIIGCETTISNLNFVPDFLIQPSVATHSKVPYYLRIRKAMQYGKTLDDYVEIMSKKSAGDYACTWFLGDINTGEIMMLEDGGKHIGVERTHDGAFHASNNAMTPEIAALDTTHDNKYNPDSTTGARHLRMEYLLFDKYRGKLDTTNAKKILADHYDVSENKYKMGKMNICKHAELEGREPNKESNKESNKNPNEERRDLKGTLVPLKGKGPRKTVGFPKGATDGKVIDSSMARRMQFEGRMGSPCGRIFRKSDYGVPLSAPIFDMPRHKWTKLL